MNTGFIYSLNSQSAKSQYIGSTTQPLSIRLSKHKNAYKGYQAGTKNVYRISSYEILSQPDCEIKLISKVEFENRTELYKAEQEILEREKQGDFRVVNKNAAFSKLKKNDYLRQWNLNKKLNLQKNIL